MGNVMENLIETIYKAIDVIKTLGGILSNFFRTKSTCWMRKNKKIVMMRRYSRCRFVKKTCYKMRHRESRAEIGGTGCI